MPKGLSIKTTGKVPMPMAFEEQDTVEETDATEETQTASEEEATTTEEKADAIDYEAELAKERERATKAEEALAAKAFKERKDKREEKVEETDDEDDDKPLTRKELLATLAADRLATQKATQEATALEIARANTSSEAEAQAALTFWKNRVVPTGDLSEDVQFAIAGLNRKKIVAKTAELARALRSKETAAKDTASTQRDAAPALEAKNLSPQDAQAIKMAGMVWDGTKRAYKKPLGQGKFLYFDPKTKKRWKA